MTSAFSESISPFAGSLRFSCVLVLVLGVHRLPARKALMGWPSAFLCHWGLLGGGGDRLEPDFARSTRLAGASGLRSG